MTITDYLKINFEFWKRHKVLQHFTFRMNFSCENQTFQSQAIFYLVRRDISYLVQKWTVSDIQSIHLSPEFWKWIKGML